MDKRISRSPSLFVDRSDPENNQKFRRFMHSWLRPKLRTLVLEPGEANRAASIGVGQSRMWPTEARVLSASENRSFGPLTSARLSFLAA